MSSSSSARISISSDEVNLLIYRYLVEAGFKHSSFVFHGESLLQRSPNLLQADLPPGTLVTLLQKALLFMYVETHVSNDGKPIKCDEVFSLLKPHDHDHGPLESDIANDAVDQFTKPPAKKHKPSASNGHSSNGTVPISSPAFEHKRDPVQVAPMDEPMSERLIQDDSTKPDEAISGQNAAKEEVPVQEESSKLGTLEQ